LPDPEGTIFDNYTFDPASSAVMPVNILVIFTLMSGARNGRFCDFLTTEKDVITEKKI